MNNCTYSTYLLVILLISISCSDNSEVPVFFEFNEVVNLNSTKTKIESSELGEVVDMLVNDSILVISEMFSDNVFKLFNLRTGRMISNCIKKGRGPNELTGPSVITIYKKDIFSTSPNNMNDLIYISVGDLIKEKNEFRQVDKLNIPGAFKTYPINDSVIISTGIFENGRYCLYNKHSKESLIKFGYPYDEEHKNENKIALGFAYQGLITINPETERFASVTTSSGNFEIYEISGSDFYRIFQKSYFLPKYKNDNNRGVIYLKNNKRGFISIDSTSEYIYVVYSGLSRENSDIDTFQGENILVYDWDGNPILRFKLERNIKIMSLNNDGKKIYAYGINPVTGEPEIIMYELPDHE